MFNVGYLRGSGVRKCERKDRLNVCVVRIYTHEAAEAE